MYNFLIDDNGVVYEGRGFDKQPATAMYWNSFSISLAFIGTYESTLPSAYSLGSARAFLQLMAWEGK